MRKLGFLVFIIICFLLFAGETLAEITFGPNVRVDDTGVSTSEQYHSSMAVAPDGNIYVVWQDRRNNNDDIYFTRSTNRGLSFGPNVRVDDTGASISSQRIPSIAIALNRDIYVVWTDERNGNCDIYFAKSINKGASFESNVRVNDASLLTGQQDQSSIAVAPNGDIYVVWHNIQNGNYDIYFARSTDGGASFGRNIKVDDAPDSVQSYPYNVQYYPSITVAPNGDIYVAWTDGRNGNRDIYFAKSTDGGASFGQNIRVDDTGASDSYQGEPSMAVALNGNIYVAWHDRRNNNEDIYFAKSTDEGASFETNVRVDDTGTSTSEQYTPSITVAPNGNIYLVWMDERNSIHSDIYFAKSMDEGVSFEANVRVDDTGTLISRQFDPSIAIAPNGNIYVVWEDERNGNWDIYFARRELSGDVNGDCKVNILDLVFIRNYLSQDPLSSPEAERCDVNEDNKINILDLVFVRNHLGTSCQ